MDKEKAKEDFIRRIDHYRAQYETLDQVLEASCSFIKVINAGRSFLVHNILGKQTKNVTVYEEFGRFFLSGHIQSRVVYFLMNIHLLPRSIFLSRVSDKRILGKYLADIFIFLARGKRIQSAAANRRRLSIIRTRISCK